MENLTPKKLVQFRKMSAARKQSFVAKMIAPRESPGEGGDYWISSVSAIGKACKINNVKFIKEKIDDLVEKRNETSFDRIKTMYQRNIDILYSNEEGDFLKLTPERTKAFRTNTTANTRFSMKGLPLEVKPSHVFSFDNKGNKEVGAIWFVAQLNGFKKEELGIFAELTHRYLQLNYGKTHTVNTKYCIAVDVVTGREVSYADIESGKIDSLVNATLDEIKNIMRKKS